MFKIAGAAAERGLDLADVARLAQRAAERTRTLGVAFSGCTLPGADAPLFTVPDGKMAIGLGIHGESGISAIDLPTADAVAELLVDRLLGERPADGSRRVVPIVNGLGSVKYEELYVVYRHIARLLTAAGIETVTPEVGEFCTSFDMAGLSLTLFWPDQELEELWADPADAPAYRRGAVPTNLTAVSDIFANAPADIPPSSPESQAAAILINVALQAVRTVIDDNADELGRIDAVAGDGDHGIGMQRGARAAADAAAKTVARAGGAHTVLTRAGEAWSDRAGGTSGVLWGLALRTLAGQFDDHTPPTTANIADGVRAAATAIQDFGKAKIGDATWSTLSPRSPQR